jgi:four helix bundle protein
MMQITELEVWKAAMDLAVAIFKSSGNFPETEPTGLGYQLRRTITSLPSSIAAAASRKQGKESLRYLQKAKGYLYEVETQLYLAERLGYLNEEELKDLLESVDTAKRLLFGFIKYYKRTAPAT